MEVYGIPREKLKMMWMSYYYVVSGEIENNFHRKRYVKDSAPLAASAWGGGENGVRVINNSVIIIYVIEWQAGLGWG